MSVHQVASRLTMTLIWSKKLAVYFSTTTLLTTNCDIYLNDWLPSLLLKTGMFECSYDLWVCAIKRFVYITAVTDC